MVGQKSKPQTFVITSPNIDCNSNFFTGTFCGKFVIKQQGRVVTHLRCGGIFSNRFIVYFPQNVPAKIFLKIARYMAKIWTKFETFLAHAVYIYKIDSPTLLSILSNRPVSHAYLRCLLALRLYSLIRALSNSKHVAGCPSLSSLFGKSQAFCPPFLRLGLIGEAQWAHVVV